jgi:hypothetical protein
MNKQAHWFPRLQLGKSCLCLTALGRDPYAFSASRPDGRR